MQFGPIISSLRRHRTAAALLVLEIALTCAIVSNAVFLISERLSNMDQESGIAESELITISVTGIRDDADGAAMTQQDLASLRALPGVKAAAVSNQLPFGGSSWNSDMRTTPGPSEDGVNAATYLGSEDLVETYGLRLIAGRDFKPTEYVDISALREPDSTVSVPAVIITQALSTKLFPGKKGVGQLVYSWGEKPMRVVGVAEELVRPGNWGPSETSLAAVMPVRISYDQGGRYMLRVATDKRAESLKAAVAALEANDTNRIILSQRTFEEIRNRHFENDRAMAWLLVGVCLALLLITALGIIGLASFWVQQRSRQIGIRRALGASRGQILSYFHTENLLLTTVGIVVGMVMAFGINSSLMKHYEVARLPAIYLPVGAVFLYALCQLAVFGPALRASRVPPAVATRGL